MRSSRRSYRNATEGSDARRPWGLVRFLVTLAIFAWILRSLIIAPFSIPSGSMLPTLFIGDYLFVAKWPYGYSKASFPLGFPPIKGRVFGHLPKRGDIVVFRPPGSEIDFVKRVIGLPGDSIEVAQGTLILNGRPIPREEIDTFRMPVSDNSPCRVVPPASQMLVESESGPSCLYPAYRETLPNARTFPVLDQIDSPRADHFAPVRVPAGHVFMMGDNRDDSLDSRFSPAEGGMGFVPVENLVGRALIIFWSTDGSAEYLKPWTWFSALRSDRIGKTFGNLK